MIFPLPPIPPIITLPKLIDSIRKFADWLDSKLSKEKPLSKNASLNDINRINDALNEFREQANVQVDNTEKKCLEMIDEYVEYLVCAIKEYGDISTKYGIKLEKFIRNANRIKGRISGIMKNELSIRLSLNDSGCSRVLKMFPGAQKEGEMKALLNNIIYDSTEKMAVAIESLISEIQEDFMEIITDKVELAEKEVHIRARTLKSLAGKETEKEGHDAVISRAITVQQMCFAVDEVVEVF